MTIRPTSWMAIACVAMGTPWYSEMASAQSFPPVPPVAQRQAPTPDSLPMGPVLPGLSSPVQAPAPDDQLPFDPSMAVPEADVEAFARGPVHEAFADVYELDPAANVIVTVAPPATVDELPPEQVPTGENVQWISGYWAWDTEANDYMWVSGVWRDIPPGRRWVPGYWAEATGGFQWVSGFWTNIDSQELAYLPQPPASLEVGPNVPPPADDQTWVPGNWTYVTNNYQWTPGYYMPCQQNYMWIPNQYTWTPRGCVFVSGYWDYRFARRGTLFTPVRFRQPLLSYGFGRPAFYRPRYSVNMSSFLIHLFVRPSSRNFYYGDYYGNQYASVGFSPWYRRTVVNYRAYDPAYNFYRMDSRRQGLDFDRTVSTWHQRYESNRDIRPPRLVKDQAQFIAHHQGDRTAQLAVMSHRFDEVAKQNTGGHAFHTMDRKDIDIMRQNSRVNHDLVTARQQTERNVHFTKPGDLKPGQIVDLRQKDGRDRNASHPGADGAATTHHKLVLSELPGSLKERSQHSVTAANKERETATRGGHVPPQGFSGKDRSGNSVPNGSMTNDRGANRGDRSHTPAAVDNSGNAASRLDSVKQRIEDHRAARDTGAAASRVAPTPGEVETRNPRSIDRGTPKNAGGVTDMLARDRAASNRNDNPGPAVQQQQHVPRQQQSVDRAPAGVRTPVEHAPRQIERHVPVDRAPPQPFERRAPVERQAPVERPQRAERAPAAQHAPPQRQAPASRQPAQHQPAHRRGKG